MEPPTPDVILSPLNQMRLGLRTTSGGGRKSEFKKKSHQRLDFISRIQKKLYLTLNRRKIVNLVEIKSFSSSFFLVSEESSLSPESEKRSLLLHKSQSLGLSFLPDSLPRGNRMKEQEEEEPPDDVPQSAFGITMVFPSTSELNKVSIDVAIDFSTEFL